MDDTDLEAPPCPRCGQTMRWVRTDRTVTAADQPTTALFRCDGCAIDHVQPVD